MIDWNNDMDAAPRDGSPILGWRSIQGTRLAIRPMVICWGETFWVGNKKSAHNDWEFFPLGTHRTARGLNNERHADIKPICMPRPSPDGGGSVYRRVTNQI